MLMVIAAEIAAVAQFKKSDDTQKRHRHRQLGEALEYLHDTHKIVHEDLHNGNVMITGLDKSNLVKDEEEWHQVQHPHSWRATRTLHPHPPASLPASAYLEAASHTDRTHAQDLKMAQQHTYELSILSAKKKESGAAEHMSGGNKVRRITKQSTKRNRCKSASAKANKANTH